MTRFYVKLIVRAIMNFPGSHGYSIIKNLLALPIITRKGGNWRKMDVDDILRFIALFDENLDEAPVIFVARNLCRVPQINPGTVDLCFLSEMVEDMREKS